MKPEVRELVEAARAYLDDSPYACACLGPVSDSLPGECCCTTSFRKQRERLAAAIEAVERKA